MEMKVIKRKASVAKMAGVATVDGVVVAEAEVMCKLADKEEKSAVSLSSLTMPIHPTAIVDPGARIAETAEIGPYCIVGADVEIGARTRLMANNLPRRAHHHRRGQRLLPYSTVGVASQDLKYKGERAETRIGDRNRIREFVTIHRGTQGGGLLTSIGSDCLLMTYAHVAHDVRIGDHVILGNSVGLAGHVIIDDWADVSPFAGVHQFCRIGRHAFVGPYSIIKQDVMPFSLTSHKPEVEVFGANSIGLARRGFDKAVIESLQTAFRLLTRSQLNTTQAIERIRAEVPPCAESTNCSSSSAPPSAVS